MYQGSFRTMKEQESKGIKRKKEKGKEQKAMTAKSSPMGS